MEQHFICDLLLVKKSFDDGAMRLNAAHCTEENGEKAVEIGIT